MRKVLSVKRFKAGYEVRKELVTDPFAGWSAEPISCPVGEVAEMVDLAAQLNESFRKTDDIVVDSAYTPQGLYIGSPKDAYRLCKKLGIKPELSRPDHKVCSIGFSDKDGKWYGWSHRAIFGFKIGDSVKEGDCCAVSGWTDEYLKEHPEENMSLPVGFIAKTTEDAKRMAIAFAEAVS